MEDDVKSIYRILAKDMINGLMSHTVQTQLNKLEYTADKLCNASFVTRWYWERKLLKQAEEFECKMLLMKELCDEILTDE